MQGRLKCKFCDWSTVKAYSKGGKFRGIEKAHQRLIAHVEEKHPHEYERVQEALSQSAME